MRIEADRGRTWSNSSRAVLVPPADRPVRSPPRGLCRLYETRGRLYSCFGADVKDFSAAAAALASVYATRAAFMAYTVKSSRPISRIPPNWASVRLAAESMSAWFWQRAHRYFDRVWTSVSSE